MWSCMAYKPRIFASMRRQCKWMCRFGRAVAGPKVGLPCFEQLSQGIDMGADRAWWAYQTRSVREVGIAAVCLSVKVSVEEKIQVRRIRGSATAVEPLQYCKPCSNLRSLQSIVISTNVAQCPPPKAPPTAQVSIEICTSLSKEV